MVAFLEELKKGSSYLFPNEAAGKARGSTIRIPMASTPGHGSQSRDGASRFGDVDFVIEECRRSAMRSIIGRSGVMAGSHLKAVRLGQRA
jgi:hypothetical protein